jgi:uncharacterized protein YchJ
MAILNFKCKKCGNGFDLNIGRVKFLEKYTIQMERKPICPLCKISSEDIVVLSELNKERIQYLYDRSIRKKVLQEVRPGKMLSFSSVFGIKGVIQLSFLGNDFYVHDSYCINPLCECSEVVLDFEMQGDKYQSSHGKLAYDYKLDIIKKTELDKEKAKGMIATLISKDKEIFYRRHQELKKEVRPYILRKLYKRGISKVKIGRNEQCPCGSGKKYKKCCLDKEVL